MFYVSISKEAISKVANHGKSAPEEEVLGLLMGRMEGQVLIIEDAVTGEITGGKDNVVMPGETLAKIADDIVSRRAKGNIVGWYHSHPGYGIFMSEVDNETQSKLQQFSPYVVALVADPSDGKFDIFVQDKKTNTVKPLASSQIHYYGPGEASVPEGFGKSDTDLQVIPQLEPQSQEVASTRPALTRKQILAAALVIILATSATFVVLFAASYFGNPSPLKLDNKSIANGIGSNVTITANVTGGTGGIKQVLIYYKLLKDADWKNGSMISNIQGGATYSYTILGDYVADSIEYYITVYDNANNKVTSTTSTIVVGDFYVDTSDSQVPVYVGKSATTTVTINSINDFSSPVTLNVTSLPAGITSVTFSPQQVVPPKGGKVSSTMTITALSSAEAGEYTVSVEAKHGAVARTTTVTILVTNFRIAVSQSSIVVSRGKTGTFTGNLEIKKGFKDPISLELRGLPSKGIEKTRIILSNDRIDIQGTTTFTIEIVTRSDIPTGTYDLTIVASGGGITDQEGVTLIIQ